MGDVSSRSTRKISEAVADDGNHTIDFDIFVRDAHEIDKRYLDHPYEIAPDGMPDARFAVSRCHEDEDCVALARTGQTNREDISRSFRCAMAFGLSRCAPR